MPRRTRSQSGCSTQANTYSYRTRSQGASSDPGEGSLGRRLKVLSALAYEMNSATVFVGIDGCTTRRLLLIAAIEMGRRACRGSYPKSLYRTGLTVAIHPNARSSVYPSGAAAAATLPPILPPAPGRFATIYGCLRASESFSPRVVQFSQRQAHHGHHTHGHPLKVALLRCCYRRAQV